jgi:UPF0716 protein FxsA
MCLIVSLLLIFAVYAEYKLLSILTSALSLGQVWVLVLVTALIGLHLLREQRDLNAKMQMKMMRGELNDPSELMLPITSLFSGLLLMIPGVLTDILGLALLYPPLAKILMRQAFKGGLNAFMANAQRGSGMGGGPFGGAGGPFGGAGSSQGSPDLSALFGGHVDPTQQAPSSSQATKSRTQRPQPKRKTPRSSSVDPSQVIIDVEGEVIED